MFCFVFFHFFIVSFFHFLILVCFFFLKKKKCFPHVGLSFFSFSYSCVFFLLTFLFTFFFWWQVKGNARDGRSRHQSFRVCTVNLARKVQTHKAEALL